MCCESKRIADHRLDNVHRTPANTDRPSNNDFHKMKTCQTDETYKETSQTDETYKCIALAVPLNFFL